MTLLFLLLLSWFVLFLLLSLLLLSWFVLLLLLFLLLMLLFAYSNDFPPRSPPRPLWPAVHNSLS